MSYHPNSTSDGREEFRRALALALAQDPRTQGEIAAACNLTDQTITNLKRGRSAPNFDSVRRLVHGLRLDPYAALGIEPPSPSLEVASREGGTDRQTSELATELQEAMAIVVDLARSVETMRGPTADLLAVFRRSQDLASRLERSTG